MKRLERIAERIEQWEESGEMAKAITYVIGTATLLAILWL